MENPESPVPSGQPNVLNVDDTPTSRSEREGGLVQEHWSVFILAGFFTACLVAGVMFYANFRYGKWASPIAPSSVNAVATSSHALFIEATTSAVSLGEYMYDSASIHAVVERIPETNPFSERPINPYREVRMNPFRVTEITP